MNLSVLIIGTLVVALFLLPFVLAGVGKNKNLKHVKKVLMSIASEHNCNISKSDFWSDSAIGIDESKNEVLFVYISMGKQNVQYVKLANYKSCKINNFSRTVNDISGNHTAIDRLELELTPVEKEKPTVKLDLYSAERSKLYTDELEIAEKWASTLNRMMKTRNK